MSANARQVLFHVMRALQTVCIRALDSGVAGIILDSSVNQGSDRVLLLCLENCYFVSMVHYMPDEKHYNIFVYST